MKYIASLFLFSMMVAFSATAQINTPQPSPAGSVSSTVGITSVEIDYFRPGVKGRKVFGAGEGYLVPYGEIWRTGANSGSMISFSTNVKVGDAEVKAGDYQIITKPGASSWEVMLISDPIGGNMNAFDESKVVAKNYGETHEHKRICRKDEFPSCRYQCGQYSRKHSVCLGKCHVESSY